MSKHGQNFTLNRGDVVWFQSENGIKQGTVLQRPYGRRLHAVVRDGNRVLHYVPSRKHIIRKVNADG